MLFGHRACRTTVQRSIRAPPEAVWITDAALSRVLQRFCLIKTISKRDAGSVPGPMESRRRIGKRRMAHLSEAVQIPGQDFGALWGIGGSLKGVQWQWEAPSRRQTSQTEGETTGLPTWLTEYQPLLVGDVPELSTPENSMSADREGLFMNFNQEFRKFRESLKTSSTNGAQTLCDSFNHRFKQNVILGLVSEDALFESLQSVTEAVQEVTVDKLLAASRCLSFYKAIWEGITGCKVLQPIDFGSGLLDRVLLLLAEIPCTPTVQTLVVDVISAASRDQVAQMGVGISAVVRVWISSWASLGINNNRISMEGATSDICDAVPNTQPLQESIASLAKFLGHVRLYMAREILYACTDHLLWTFENFKGPSETLRTTTYSWISVVAKTPCVDEALLIDIWSRMKFASDSSQKSEQYSLGIPQLSLHETCNLLLDFWISHGQIKGAENVRAIYTASVQKYGQSGSAGHLMQALNRCNQHWLKKAECLFRILRRLRRPKVVYRAFQNMIAQNLVPASFVGRQFYEMSRIDPRCALNMYKLYDRVKHDKTRFVPDWCPNLIIAMIRSPDFASAEIWNVLRVPALGLSPTSVSPKSLHPARVRLVHRMALEFATADCRTPRLALRNVMHCLLYLRRHRVPLSPDLTRALTEAGITRSLLGERWVGVRKADWIVNMVRKVEGREVSAEMEDTLQTWLMERIAQQRRSQREANPLRVNAID